MSKVRNCLVFSVIMSGILVVMRGSVSEMMNLGGFSLVLLEESFLPDMVIPSNRFAASDAMALGDNIVKGLNALLMKDLGTDVSLVGRLNVGACFFVVVDGGWRKEVGGDVILVKESLLLGVMCCVLEAGFEAVFEFSWSDNLM